MAWIFIIVGLILIVGCIYLWMHLFEKSSTNPQDRIDKLQDEKYDPNMTRFAARKQTAASIPRTETATQIGKETRAVKDMIVQQTEAVQAQFTLNNIGSDLSRGEELKQVSHIATVDGLNLQRLLIANAGQQGMDVTVYLEVLKTRELNKAEVEKIEQQAAAELRAGFIYQLKEYQKLTMLRGVLDELYERAYQIESGNEPQLLKARKLIQVEKDIKLHEEDADGRRKRLLQAINEEDTEESD
jgi:hypothetical protein